MKFEDTKLPKSDVIRKAFEISWNGDLMPEFINSINLWFEHKEDLDHNIVAAALLSEAGIDINVLNKEFEPEVGYYFKKISTVGDSIEILEEAPDYLRELSLIKSISMIKFLKTGAEDELKDGSQRELQSLPFFGNLMEMFRHSVIIGMAVQPTISTIDEAFNKLVDETKNLLLGDFVNNSRLDKKFQKLACSRHPIVQEAYDHMTQSPLFLEEMGEIVLSIIESLDSKGENIKPEFLSAAIMEFSSMNNNNLSSELKYGISLYAKQIKELIEGNNSSDVLEHGSEDIRQLSMVLKNKALERILEGLSQYGDSIKRPNRAHLLHEIVSSYDAINRGIKNIQDLPLGLQNEYSKLSSQVSEKLISGLSGSSLNMSEALGKEHRNNEKLKEKFNKVVPTDFVKARRVSAMFNYEEMGLPDHPTLRKTFDDATMNLNELKDYGAPIVNRIISMVSDVDYDFLSAVMIATSKLGKDQSNTEQLMGLRINNYLQDLNDVMGKEPDLDKLLNASINVKQFSLAVATQSLEEMQKEMEDRIKDDIPVWDIFSIKLFEDMKAVAKAVMPTQSNLDKKYEALELSLDNDYSKWLKRMAGWQNNKSWHNRFGPR